MTLSSFVDLWLEKHAYVNKTHGAALRDEIHLRKHVVPVLGSVKLRSLTRQQVVFLFSDMARASKLAPKTINNCLGTLKKVLNDAVDWGYVSANQAKNVKPLKLHQREVTIFTRDEVQKLLVFTQDEYPEEHRLISFALNTGCRLGECAALKWNKVDLAGRFVMIEATYEEKTKKVVARTKGKRFRRVPLNDEAVAVLRTLHLAGRRGESELVFNRISYYAVTHAKFRRILWRAGLADALARRATFHCLRHTFASEFMRTGGRLSDLQQVLGHSTAQQTEKYVHFTANYLAGATRNVSFAAPAGTVVAIGPAATPGT